LTFGGKFYFYVIKIDGIAQKIAKMTWNIQKFLLNY